MSRLKIAVERVRAGAWDDVINSAYERYKAGGRFSIVDAFTAEIEARVLERYEGKIRAGFARAGIDLPEGEALTVQGIAAIVSERTGIEFDGDLSRASITAGIDKVLAERLSSELGVQVSTVLDPEALKAGVLDQVRAAIADGRAEKWIERGALMAARRHAAWKNAGVDTPEEQKRIRARAAQKKYRRTHVEVWD